MIQKKADTSLLAIYERNPSVCIDTRKIKKGDMFFAIRGERFDGNQFAKQALDAGASYAIVDREEVCVEGDERYIYVANSLFSLQMLAKAWRNTLDIPVIAITGSNGKTTTKELIRSVLATRKKVFATQGNFNNHIGVPLTLLSIPKDTEIAIVEMGTNQPGDIAELVSLTHPTHGLITNIGYAHLEKLKSQEGILAEKGVLFDHLRIAQGMVFLNVADPLLPKLDDHLRLFTYGDIGADICASINKNTLSGMELELYVNGEFGTHTFHTQLSGTYNAINIQAAIAVGLHFGIPIDHIKVGIQSYAPENQRSQLIQKGELSIWMDAYNANPSSMKAAIQHVMEMEKAKTVLILGDMKELGSKSIDYHREIGRFVNTFLPYLTIGIGPEMKEALTEIKSRTLWFEDVEAAKNIVFTFLKKADLALLKGSRSMKLETLIETL